MVHHAFAITVTIWSEEFVSIKYWTAAQPISSGTVSLVFVISVIHTRMDIALHHQSIQPIALKTHIGMVSAVLAMPDTIWLVVYAWLFRHVHSQWFGAAVLVFAPVALSSLDRHAK
jgi:hypothetical protein